MSTATPNTDEPCSHAERVVCRDCGRLGCGDCDVGLHYHCTRCDTWICPDCLCGDDADCDECKRSFCSECLMLFTNDSVERVVAATPPSLCFACVRTALARAEGRQRRAARDREARNYAH